MLKLKSFYQHSLERKIFLSTYLIILISLPLLGIFSYSQASRVLENYAYNAVQQTMNQLSTNISNELTEAQARLFFINSSDQMKDALNWIHGNNDSTFALTYNEIYSLFAQTRITSDSIESIYMYSPKGEFYEGVPHQRNETSFTSTPYYRLMQGSTSLHWVSYADNPLYNGSGQVISLVTRPVSDQIYPSDQVYLVVNLSLNSMLTKLQAVNFAKGGFVLLLDDQGSRIASTTAPIQLSGDFLKTKQIENLGQQPDYFELKVAGQSYLVNHQRIAAAGWQALIIQPKDQVLGQVNSIKYFSWILIAVLLLCSFYLSRRIAAWITKPLRRLERSIVEVIEGNLDTQFESDSQDEVGKIGNSFNAMVQTIQQLLEQVEKEGALKRQAEMKALQAQINPHFLYNTLDELYWKVLDLEDPTASEMILSLSRFFRLSLNQGKELTTVAKEMEHVEHYLKILKEQYKRQFTFSVAQDDRVKLIEIPKIILQPLVENSLLHGFKDNAYDSYHIGVKSEWKEPDLLLMSVEDTGCGMPIEQVKQLERLTITDLHDDNPESGYAIVNVKERLFHMFGYRFQFHIHSELSKGTRVEIWIRIEGENKQ